MSTAIPSPRTTAQALGMLRAALEFLNTADATAMAAQAQAECLQALEQSDAMVTAARASILAAFAAGQGHRRSRSGQPDHDRPDETFEDRAVPLETTLDGAGVLHANLTPECAAALTAVLDALSAPAEEEDTRSHEQRYHDGLQEAMQRLLAAGLLPERAGQPVKAWVHISLTDLMMLEGSSALLEEWTAQIRARWAAHRAEASADGGHAGAWLDGDAAASAACDASVTPVVTGEINHAAFDDLVRLCVELARLHRDAAGDGAVPNGNADAGRASHSAQPDNAQPGCAQSDSTQGGSAQPDNAQPGCAQPDSTRGGSARDGSSQDSGGGPDTPAREALEQAVIGAAVELLSGSGGLASFLRRRQPG